jgi:MinD-like ATPase involved in chromosome partitioning or flagellar assembly
LFRRRRKRIRVLVATRDPHVPAALAAATQVRGSSINMELTEAVSTQGAYDALPGCSLAVIDAVDLVPSPTLPLETLTSALRHADMPVIDGARFAQDPQAALEQAAAATGLLAALPPRVVVIAAYSGGVGKTSLSLSLARYVAGQLRLPTAIAEANHGQSALLALTGADVPDLHDVLTQGAEPGQWRARNGGPITMLPMNYTSARLLLSRTEELAQLLAALARDHVLTVVDANAANPFFPHLWKRSHMALVVADPRPDAVVNAHALVEELGAEGGHRRSGACVVLNKVNGMGDRLALSQLEAAARLPLVPSPDRDRRLAESLLQIIYPGWRPQ